MLTSKERKQAIKAALASYLRDVGDLLDAYSVGEAAGLDGLDPDFEDDAVEVFEGLTTKCFEMAEALDE